MKLLERIVKIIFNILIIVMIFLVIIVSYNFIQINMLKKQFSNFFGYTIFEISTGSMSGTIEINDVILVKITQDVNKDDIITFQKKDEVITHRVIAENDDTLITKGDANNSQDVPIQKSDVIGKVIKIIPRLGIWVKVLSDTKVIGSIIITFILFGFAVSTNTKEEKQVNKKSFSKFMRKRREKRNEKSKEKKES